VRLVEDGLRVIQAPPAPLRLGVHEKGVRPGAHDERELARWARRRRDAQDVIEHAPRDIASWGARIGAQYDSSRDRLGAPSFEHDGRDHIERQAGCRRALPAQSYDLGRPRPQRGADRSPPCQRVARADRAEREAPPAVGV
jgi:hypothetical protein